MNSRISINERFSMGIFWFLVSVFINSISLVRFGRSIREVRAQMDFRLTCIVSFVKRIVMDFRAINLFILDVWCAWCALEILFQETKYIVDINVENQRQNYGKVQTNTMPLKPQLQHQCNLLCLFSVNWWLNFFFYLATAAA